jgi:apolipoprotein N-acyltransferase
MFAITLGYGHWRIQQGPAADAPSVRVGLVQGNIDITMKADPAEAGAIYDHYLKWSQEAVEQARRDGGRPLDLIVWPETMFRSALHGFADDFKTPDGSTIGEFNARVQARSGTNAKIAETVGLLGSPMLLGIDRLRWHTETEYEHYNSAVFVDASGKQLAHYDKMHLVMFGEYVPFADWFPWLYKLTPLPGGAKAGSGPAACEIHGFRFAPNICYETVIPHLIRRQIAQLREQGQEPDVLVNVTNDGWFWGSSELDLHLRCGVFRAVECRKPLVIAANTGFSAWINGDGRIIKQGPRHEAAALVANVQRDPRQSLYLTIGDWPSAVCLLVCVGLAIVGYRDLRCTAKAR